MHKLNYLVIKNAIILKYREIFKKCKLKKNYFLKQYDNLTINLSWQLVGGKLHCYLLTIFSQGVFITNPIML